jgi:hypothetical protein
MDLFDPTIATERSGIDFAARPKSLRGLKVGLVENTKFNSEVLLKKLGERLQQQYGMTVVHLAHKKSSGSPVYPKDVAELKTKADFVVAGVGD